MSKFVFLLLLINISGKALENPKFFEDNNYFCKMEVFPSMSLEVEKFKCGSTSAFQPQITIYGENHNSKIDQERKLALIEASDNNEYLIALEGYFSASNISSQLQFQYNLSGKNAYGLENEFVFGITNLVIDNHHLFHEHSFENFPNFIYNSNYDYLAKKIALIITIEENKFLRSLWPQVKVALNTEIEQELSELIQSYLDNSKQVDYLDKVSYLEKLIQNSSIFSYSDKRKKVVTYEQEIFDPIKNEKSSQMIEIFKRQEDLVFEKITKSYLNEILKLLEKEDRYRELIPDIIQLKDAIDNHEYFGVIETFIHLFVVNWRNFSWLVNLKPLYCKAVEQKKNLKIVVGQLHVNGLKCLLEMATAKSVSVQDTMDSSSN